MAKALNQTSLVFTADTSKAKQQIQELQQALSQLASGASLSRELPLTSELRKAIEMTNELKAHLQAATNVTTGGLDFSKLSASLKASGKDLSDYGYNLQKLGPQGQQAFMQLTSAVSQSELKIRSTKGLLKEFGTTLMNTARWQISSSILHGFIGALQSSYRYAQDLNESLNNIRIVTGQSVEQMETFAEKANKSAKNLSTTTLKYTDASLIYYQQGLNDKEVEERTNTTIKMANVSRQAAEEVSSQMTAIWNNFDNGSKSLEYYGDVITALGAKTAASSSEIATGLEKFAAVSKTIGLSYEYASAALATIVAQTRQSADTVGTALRTLFSRLEGLKLGETLEDGTDLNKYSAALKAVGVDIKTASGELKDMDTILDELGQKWQMLTKDQQVALAQTVGGVRQYTNLIALMDNWDVMQQNVQIARGSEGTLSAQADIYAESWEAASNRARASIENFYSTIINDKAFINLTNTIAKVVDGISSMVEGLGGIPAILTTIGSLSMVMFKDKMAQGLTSVGEKLKMLNPKYNANLRQERTKELQKLSDRIQDADTGVRSAEDLTNRRSMRQQAYLQAKFSQKAGAMSEEQIANTQRKLDNLNTFQQQAARSGQRQDASLNIRESTQLAFRTQAIQQLAPMHKTDKEIDQDIKAIKNNARVLSIQIDVDKTDLETLKQELEAFKQENQDIELGINLKDPNLTVQGIKDQIKVVQDAATAENEQLEEQYQNNGMGDEFRAYQQTANQEAQDQMVHQKDTVQVQQAYDELNEDLDKPAKGQAQIATTLAGVASAAMATTGAIMGLKNAYDALNDPDATGWDKFSAIMSAVVPAIMAVVSVMNLMPAAGAAAAAGEMAAMGPIGWVIAAFIALAAAVAAVVIALSSMDSPAKQLEHAKKAVEELTTAEEEAKAAADELSSAIEHYHDAKTALEECVEGTDAWKDALLEVKQAALDVIEVSGALLSNDQLEKIIQSYKNNNGFIDEELLAEAQQVADTRAQQISYAKTSAEYNEAIKSREVGREQLFNIITEDNHINRDQYGVQKILQFKSWLQDYISANEKDILEMTSIDDFKAVLPQEYSNMLIRMDNTVLKRMQTLVKGYTESFDKAFELYNLSANMEIGQMFPDKNYDIGAVAYATQNSQKKVGERTVEWEKFLKDEMGGADFFYKDRLYSSNIAASSGTDNSVYQATLRALQDAGYNYEAAQDEGNAIQGIDSNRKFVFYDKTAGKDTKAIDYSTIATIIASMESLQDVGANLDEAQALLNSVVENQNDFDLISSGFLNYDQTKGSIDWNNFLKSRTIGQLKDIEGFEFNEDALKQLAEKLNLDYDTILTSLLEGSTDAIDKLQAKNEKLIAPSIENIYDSFVNGLGDAFSQEGKNAISTQFYNAFEKAGGGPAGQKAVQSVADFYNEIADPELRQKAIVELSKTSDLTNISIDELTKKLQALGIDTSSISTTNLENFVNILKEIATISFNDLAESYQKIHKAIDNIEQGDTIDPEIYKLLGTDSQKYFSLMLDGTYKLTGNAKELQKTEQKTQISKFKNLEDENNKKIEQIDQLKKYQPQGKTLSQSAKSKTGEAQEEQLDDQLSFLAKFKELAGVDATTLENWQKALTEGTLTADEMDKIAAAVNKTGVTSETATLESQKQEYQDQNVDYNKAIALSAKDIFELQDLKDAGEITLDSFNAALKELAVTGLSTAKSIDELEIATTQFGKAGAEIPYDLYSKNLIRLGENYDNCAEELLAYKEVLTSGNAELIAAAENNLKAAITAGEMAKNTSLDSEELENYGKSLEKNSKIAENVDLQGTENDERRAEAATGLAVKMLLVDRAVESLRSNYKEWAKTLKEADKRSSKYSKALANMQKVMSDLVSTGDFKVDGTLFDAKFFEDNAEDFQKAADGDKEALVNLEKAAAKVAAAKIDTSGFKAAGQDFQTALQGIMDQIPTEGLEIGVSISELQGGDAFIAGLNELIVAGDATAAQVSAALSALGFNPKITYQEVEVATVNETSADGYTTFTDVNGVTHTVENTGITGTEGHQVASIPIIDAGGTTYGGGGGGGTPPKGGGGGGGKKKHIQKKEPEEAKDRYHVVKNQLEEQESQYKRIDTAYQRAFGKSKLDLLDKQIAKQKQLIKTQKQYLDEAKEYLKYDKQQLELDARKQVYNEETNEYTTVDTSVAGLGMSIEWNETGGIDNIDAIMKANLDRYNAEVDRINKALDSGKMTQEEADWAQKVAEAQYQGLLDTIGQYEETQDFVNEKLQDFIDAQNQYYDQLLEKTKLRVQLRVEVDEDSLNLINFLLERLEADAYKAAQRIDKLGDSFAASADKMDAYKWGLIDLLANHGDENAEGTFAKLMAGEITPEQLLQQMQEGGNTFTQAEADAIREYMQNIMSEATEQLEIQKKVIEEIGTVLEENNRRLDRQISKIEHLQNVMSSYKNIIDLSGRQFLGITSEIYDAMEEANVKLANDTLEADKARMDASNAWLQKIKEDYAAVYDTLTDEAKKAYEEQIEAAEDAAQEATEAYYSSWEAAIEAINTRFESAMQHMAEDFSKTMAGVAGNLEGVQQRMDLRKMVADVYVPEYEKMYQLTKLTREAQKSIDNASNVKVKQELLRVQQKIVEAQESGAKISQYELDYLQRELDLKAAQMALEEASKAKSQVRMTRDSEGNYAYVYTANEEAVEEAEQNYADKLYEMQKLNEEYVASLQDMLVELESNYIQALQDAAEMYGQGTEEYASAVADIQSQYGTYFDELMSEMGLVLSNNKETETIHAEIYKRLTGDVYQANVDLQTSWEETTLAGVTGYETLGQYQTAWAAASQKAYDDVIQANDIWMASMAEAYNLAGESIDTFAQTVGGDFEQIKEESQSLKEQIVEEDLPAMTEAINEVSEAVKSWQETYAEAIKAMLEDTENMIAKYNELLAKWSEVDRKHQAAEQQGNANDANSSTGTQTNGNNSNNNNGNTKSSSGGGKGGSSGSTGNEGGYGGGSGTSALIGGNNAIRNLTMLRFATGGYTGDWAGDGGKIAVLDRKELVLNAQDTFNILKAVDMIKSISQTIDINAMSAGGAFSNLISPFVAGAGDRLEQEVHITAEFPNVTNKNEILEAFDNVINLASQYANR